MPKRPRNPTRFNPRLGWVCALLAYRILVATPADAQAPYSQRKPDSFINRQRAMEDDMRRAFDEQLGDSQDALFDWGGWYNAFLFSFDDGVESSRTLRRQDLRVWGRLSLQHGAHEVYARVRLSQLDFNSGQAYDGNDNDIEGPNLERGFYRFDLAKFRRSEGDDPIDYNLIVEAGRDLVQLGSGLALATPLDHVSIQGTYRSFQLTGFAGRTVGSTQDFDLSRRASRTHRNLYGGQLKYRGWERHEPFVYAFWQKDRNHETLLPLFQRFDYDSLYLGLGSTGELAERWRYSTEWIYESGESFGHRRFFGRHDIRAWAAMAEVEYLFPGKHKARASAEYVFGSGDGDRFGSPSNTVGGNLADSQDSGFVGLGYRDSGLVLAPRISNLHMWRVSASCYPWPEKERFRRLELGTNWYLYYKHHASGAISDPTASVRSGYVGWEMDWFANWRISSDVAWTTRMGFFTPGDAFDDSGVRAFFLLGVTWSF